MDSTLASLSLNATRTADARAGIDAARTPNQKAAREVAENFEAMFIAQMLEHMSRDIGQDNMFNGGNSERIHRSMLNEQYADEISKRGGVGIADAVYREILKLQEV